MPKPKQVTIYCKKRCLKSKGKFFEVGEAFTGTAQECRELSSSGRFTDQAPAEEAPAKEAPKKKRAAPAVPLKKKAND